MSRTIEFDKVAAVLSERPFALDRAALGSVKALIFGPGLAARYIAESGVHVPCWQADKAHLLAFHGIADEHHCLHVAAHEWLWTLERQATEGLGHFLDPPSRSLKLARVAAFLKALPAPAGGWPDPIDTAVVRTEHRTGRGKGGRSGGRIDLLVAAGGPAGFAAAIIEAKFGHDLRANPLGDYVRAAEAMGLQRDACAFLVLGFCKDPIVRARLKRNPLWQFIGWRRLLRSLEAEMSPQIDDEDYRRFRRTLFARVH